METPTREQRGWDHFMTAVGLIAEFLAGKFGISVLAWLGAVFLFLSFLNYTKKFFSAKRVAYRLVSYFVAVVVLSVITLFVTGVFHFGRSEEQATRTIPDTPTPKQQPPPQPVPVPPTANAKPHKEKPPTQESHGDNSPNVGPVTQGSCSNLQIGGQNNTATVSCVPPARHLLPTECDALKKVVKDKSIPLEIKYVINVPDSYDYAQDFYQCLKSDVKLEGGGPVAVTLQGGTFDGGIAVEFNGPEGSPGKTHVVPLDGSPLATVFLALFTAKLQFQPHSTPYQPEGRISVLIGEPPKQP
jgi:hypothetical protein